MLVRAGAVEIARGRPVRDLVQQIGLTASDRDIVLAELDQPRHR